MANWSQNIGSFLKNLFVKDEPQPMSQTLMINRAADDDPKSFKHKLKRYYQSRADVEMKTWKRAVAMAEDELRPRREELYRLYHRSMEDDHLLSQIRTARFTVRMSEFKLLAGDKEADAKLIELFERPWFHDFLQHAVDSEFYGHSLIEFDSRLQDGEFKRVTIIPREHVRPEYGDVVISVHDEKGIPYRERPINKYLVEIGESNDLGLLKVLSKIVIRKEYSLVDWSRRNEKFGMPFLILNTTSRDKTELDAKEEMAANFGSNAYAIFDDQDKATLLESNQAFTYQTFKDFGAWADAAIAMLVNGQTGTSEEKAFVGSAEVHERILNTYTKDRMKRIQYIINFTLIPFLVSHGYPLQGIRFQFIDLLPSSKKADSMDNDTPPPAPGEDEKKKQPGKSLTLATPKPNPMAEELHHIYNGVACCEHHGAHRLADGIDVNDIIEKAARKVFDQKLAAGELDEASWKYFSDQLDQALTEARGKTLYETSYRNATDWELAAQLRNNIFIFAAFKNHRNITDMVDNLTDEQGNLREWADFKQAAEQISKNYFEAWLKAEYNTAVATGQTAAKWRQFQDNKDVLPTLTYVTQRDELVRDAHKVLEGVTKKVDDPFWDRFYPPNGWNCRCDIIQSADEETEHTLEPNEQQVPPIFRNNPGKTAKLFPDNHPYYHDISTPVKARLMQALSLVRYRNYGPDWTRINHTPATNGYLVAHKDADPARLADNNQVGAMLAKEGKQVEILPMQSTLSPDASVTGLLYTFVVAASVEDAMEKIAKDKARGRRMLVVLTDGDAQELREKVKGMEGVEVEVR